MSNPRSVSTRRLELTLKRSSLAPWGRLKPTVVIDGRGQPGQWGTGTWQIPVDEPATVRVYLYNRLWKFGHAEYTLTEHQPARLVYRSPALPFLSGSLKPPTS